MTTINSHRKYTTVGPIPGELVDDGQSYPTLLAIRESEWRQAVQREGYRPVDSPVSRLTDPVVTVFNNHDGRGWLYRLFHRYREWTSTNYMLRFEGYCQPL